MDYCSSFLRSLSLQPLGIVNDKLYSKPLNPELLKHSHKLEGKEVERNYIRIMLKRISGALLLSLLALQVTAQSPKTRVPTYFGFQVKPIFPTRFIGEPTLTQKVENYETTISQRIGYSFGGVVRVGLTKFIALETGINFNQRNFNLDMSIPDSSVYASNDLSFVTYEIPVNGLIYIRLDEKWYMNTSIGVALSYNPTNVGVKTIPGTGQHIFRHTGLAKKVVFEFNANVGFEYRTEKSGTFYLGGSACVPFSPIFYLLSEYTYSGYHIETDAQNDGKVDGSYLSLDFKYFFPNIKSKGSPFKAGPIEQ